MIEPLFSVFVAHVRALWTNATTEFGVQVVFDIRVGTLPVALIVPNPEAPRTNRYDSRKSIDSLKRLFEFPAWPVRERDEENAFFGFIDLIKPY